DPSCRQADVGTVLAQGDTAQQHLHVRLAEGGVGAGRAALRTVEARVDARDQRAGVYLDRSRMRLQHLLSVGHVNLLVAAASTRDFSVEPRAKPPIKEGLRSGLGCR